MAVQIQPKKETDWLTPVLVTAGIAGMGLGLYFWMKKEPQPGVFDIHQPTVTPSSAGLGESVDIHCEVTMTSGESFTGSIIITVSEGSLLPGAGDTLETKAFQMQMSPGQTAKIDWNWTTKGATAGLIAGIKGTSGWKDIAVQINNKDAVLDSHHFDDCLVVIGRGTGVVINSISKPGNVAYGQNISIQINFTYSGTDPNLVLEVNLGERNLAGGSFTVEDAMTWRKTVPVISGTQTISMPFTVPTNVPAKEYDVLTRVLTASLVELGTRQDSGMVTIVENPSGAIDGFILEYSDIYVILPAQNIPSNSIAKIHVMAMNNGTARRSARCLYTVVGPTGASIYEFDGTDNYAEPGEELDFYPIVATFNINLAGRYDITATLYLDGVPVDTKTSYFTAIQPQEILSLTIVSDPWWRGTINTNPEKPLYAVGEVIVCTADPFLGSSFSYWDIDGEFLDTNNPISLVLMANYTLTAHFV